MGALTVATLLAAVTLAAASGTAPGGAERFDRIAVPLPDASPRALVSVQDGAWRSSPVDVFADEGGGATAYLRARDLGDPGARAPFAARLRVVARRAGEHGEQVREGFLVPAAESKQRLGRMDAERFRGPVFSLAFPGGSGFYRTLAVVGSETPLVRAVRLRLVAELPAGITVERTDDDSRWTLDGIDTGARLVRRRSSAAVRALWRYTDPRPQTAFFTRETIEQDVPIDLPRTVLALAHGVQLENGFEVPPDTRVLLPGADAWRALDELPERVPYDAIALANAGGVLVHRLRRDGAARELEPVLYAKRGDEAAEIGYRIEHAERAAAATDAGARGFVLGQDVAVLGGGTYASALTGDAEETRALAAELAADAPPWRVEVETLR